MAVRIPIHPSYVLSSGYIEDKYNGGIIRRSGVVGNPLKPTGRVLTNELEN